MKVSISVVMASVIALSAAIAAIVAFVPTYTTGIDSTQDTVDSLRENIIGRVDNAVSNFFKGPAKAAETVDLMARSGVNFTSGADVDIVGRLCDQVHAHEGVNHASLIGTDTLWVCANNLGPNPIGGAYNGTFTFMYNYNRSARNWTYTTNTVTGLLEPVPWAVAPFVDANPNDLYTVFARTSNYHEPGRYWSAAENGLESAQYIAFAFLPQPEGRKKLIFSVQVLTGAISIHLATLGLHRRARALAVDGTNGIVVGNSWGAPMTKLLDFMNFSAPPDARMKLFTLSDMNDTLIKDAITHLGGEQAFYDIKTSYSGVMGSGYGKTYIDAFRIMNTAGLDMRILLAMPEIDFLEDTYAARNKTLAAVSSAFAVLILLAIVFSILIARPLHRLGDRMYKTASLQDDDADDAPSILSEVRSMQEAYTTMKQELNRMKSYLPQSVLCAMYDEGEPEEPEENDEGDIESMSKAGSSVLSGSGMNSSLQRSHSSTRSQMTSSVRESGRGSGVLVAQLNTAKSVVSKRVVVVAFNLCGFQKRLEGGRGAKDLPELQARFLTLVNKHVRENKGVVDTFQGDHILASFNAVSNVVSAPKRAALAAMHACQEAAKDPELPPVSVGISAGVAFVGNMGNSDMQRFNIVGPVYVEALMMERLAREQLASSSSSSSNSSTATTKPWRILGLGNIIQDISLEFYYCCCDIVHCPGAKNKLEIAISIDRLKSVATGEWMYMLEEGANADPFVEINDAFAHALESDGETAMQAMSAASSKIADDGHDDDENASSAAENDTTATIATALSRLHVLMSFAGKDGEGIAAEATKVAFIGTE